MPNEEKGFEKFKKRIQLELLIQSIISSLFISLVVISSLLLYVKIKDIEYSLLYLILIALGIFVILFCLLFIIRKPSKIKIAKRIDKELNLKEKVQTMVAYENESSFMIDLQRKSTYDTLNGINVKKLAMKFSIVSLVLLLISCVFCVSAIAYPEKIEEEPPIIDNDYDADDWTIRALKDLIKEVEKSNINEELKKQDVYELNELLKNIQNAEKESEMVAFVTNTITNINLQLDTINSNKRIYETLRYSTITAISTLAIKILNLSVEDIPNALDQIDATINGSSEGISELNEQFGVVLRKSTLDKDDELYIQLFTLSENLNGCIGSSNIYDAVNTVIKDSKDKIITVIERQKLNSDMTEYIIYTLKEIFGLIENKGDNETDDPTISTTDPNNPNPKEDDDKKVNEGGLGTGEVLVGSDDIFFDPETGEVKYGDVITSYYGLISGKLDDGVLPEEYKEYFEKYFKLLFGTLENKNEGE